MDTQTITHARPSDNSPLHRETTTRALRYSVWLSLYLAQQLDLDALEDTLTATLVDVDALVRDLSEAV